MTDFRKPLKRPIICCGDTSQKFQGPIARFTGSSNVSLPMPCSAAEDERVVDLLVRTLHPMCEPLDDVLGVAPKYFVDMVAPGRGLGRVAALRRWAGGTS